MGNYKPNEMLDEVKRGMGIFTDLALARALCVESRLVKHLRIHHTPLTAEWILRIHSFTGWGVDYIRGLAGDDSEGYFRKPRGGRYKYFWGDQ